MEPAKIDWPNLKSVFAIDDLYEHINAPQWIDLSSPIDPVDDESWFCTLECNHPKTAEDFLKETPNSKIKKSVLPLGNLKRRGFSQSSNSPNYVGSKSGRFMEDGENQNPNFSTPSKQYNSMKAKILTSNSEKKKKPMIDSAMEEEDGVVHKLKRTLSSRNLFNGRNLIGPITEFCNELKRLAMRTKEKEKPEKTDAIGSPLQRKPLLETSTEKSRPLEEDENINIIIEEKPRRKKKDHFEDGENIAPKPKVNEHQQSQTLAPKPQSFSVTRQPLMKSSTPNKPSRSRTLGRGILQELEQNDVVAMGREERVAAAAAEKEERSLDVFWFLKPCTYAN